MNTHSNMCVSVYMYVLEWNFLFWSGLPDPANENIPAVKKNWQCLVFSHNNICFESTNILSIWAKNQNNSDGKQNVIVTTDNF